MHADSCSVQSGMPKDLFGAQMLQVSCTTGHVRGRQASLTSTRDAKAYDLRWPASVTCYRSHANFTPEPSLPSPDRGGVQGAGPTSSSAMKCLESSPEFFRCPQSI